MLRSIRLADATHGACEASATMNGTRRSSARSLSRISQGFVLFHQANPLPFQIRLMPEDDFLCATGIQPSRTAYMCYVPRNWDVLIIPSSLILTIDLSSDIPASIGSKRSYLSLVNHQFRPDHICRYFTFVVLT